MGKPNIEPGLRLRLFDLNGIDHLPILLNEAEPPRITLELRNTGAFPVAVWGLPQNKDAKKVPGRRRDRRDRGPHARLPRHDRAGPAAR